MPGRLPTVCFIAPNAFPLLAKDSGIRFSGGAELQQVLIAKGLVARGYSVSMICIDFGQEDITEIDGIQVYRAFRQDAGVPVLRFIWPRLTSIWRCLKRANADIYYQRAGSMLTGVMAAFCGHYGRKSIFAIAGESKFRFRRDRWLYEYGVRHVDRVVVQNTAQARLVSDRIGRDSILIPSIYHTEDSASLTSQQHVLWVGMIRKVKRPDIFLDIVQSIPDQQFVMIGGESVGESKLYDAIKERAGKLVNLSFTGFVPYSEVGQYFDNAILFINTSDSEGFPNTFLQAWARGVPTVSFVNSGAAMNGEPIGLVSSSVEEMSSVIADLVDDSERRLRLGKLAKHYVELNHAPQQVLDLYECLFRDIMHMHVPGSRSRQ